MTKLSINIVEYEKLISKKAGLAGISSIPVSFLNAARNVSRNVLKIQ